jgi:2-oxoisovalerate dehydrogenase E1 component beta subunit
MTTMTLVKAITSGLRTAMDADERVVLLGEDIGVNGGVYRVTDGLQQQFGPRRVIDTPLAESAILGTAIGLAYRGFRPVVEIQFDGFLYPAFDQLVSQVAKMRYRTAGRVGLPLTIRIPFGGGIGAAEHHSESPEAYLAHTAGIRTVAVSEPQDAETMIRQAIACDDPVVYLEPKRRYHTRADVEEGRPLDAVLPMDAARVLRPGSDVTVVAYGAMVGIAVDAAIAAADEGLSLEVIDLRSLSPVDYATVERSVRKTGRLVIVHEAAGNVGLGAEISATITERCFDDLEHAPVRVTGHDIPYPAAKLEAHHQPDLDRVLHGVDRALDRVLSSTGAVR